MLLDICNIVSISMHLCMLAVVLSTVKISTLCCILFLVFSTLLPCKFDAWAFIENITVCASLIIFAEVS